MGVDLGVGLGVGMGLGLGCRFGCRFGYKYKFGFGYSYRIWILFIHWIEFKIASYLFVFQLGFVYRV